jgi:hypothetical protein
MLNRRRFLQLATAAAATCTATGVYACQIEPHWVEFVRKDMPVRNLPRHLVGRTLVQLSDIHVGPHVDDDFVRRVFHQVQALQPDIVTVTGDFISHEPGILEHAAKVYPDLPRGRLATVGIWGNHDYGPRWECCATASGLKQILARAGMTVLANEAIEVEGLRLIGLDDRWGPNFDPAPILSTTRAGAPEIVLSHNPDNVDLPVWGGFDGWVLSGHTHGGQCRPPFLPAPYLSVENRRYSAGEFALSGNRRLYISRGLGHKQQIRFNVRPEVTLFTLTQAA